MPIREDYYCKICNEVFEYNKYYGEEFPKNPKCPKCGKNNTKRKVTIGNIVIPDYMRSTNG